MDNFKMIDDKKYMWDGEEYESEAAAQENMSKYNEDNFETRLLEEEGKYIVYTRRLVTEIVVEGEPA
ncbi:MAG: hypothetical protein GY950_16315 [bacterium]|nr:hypothetical protein [bacterium]